MSIVCKINVMTLNIAKDYSLFTGLRYCDISEHSGEDFYHKMLNEKFNEALEKHEKLLVVLDDVEDDGYSPSFIDEAFGNLVYDFSGKIVKENLILQSEKDPHIINQVFEMTIPKWEERRKGKDSPKKTMKHSPWFRLTDKGIEKKVWINGTTN